MATRVIRQVLVDHARRRDRRKRGGDFHRVPLTESSLVAGVAPPDRGNEVLAVHEALELLARIDPFQAEVAELRLFGGLTLEQVALVTEKPLRQVRTRWHLARAWLGSRVRRDGDRPDDVRAPAG
jgi:RNA polymerase sigma factor (TIGR02999 family)